ncbi:Na+/H+ antiporter NhaD/arsenite permease-like protein [Peribacillus deserti]|uniref:Na+/H+ antiporter NhaD/arsenite permease-like protein n=1 Tax=Peribacillus deserti TaxID=673318 RepID=A0ABS2QM06_9BACI|nr:ArsB/NhaD family transporter [Peribacillus deserti]MBM7694203.1 Na+/H+ antiporter NhaD/arsenite permease-like protein [Peribacillus deserti]
MENQALIAVTIFLITYAIIITEKIHRTIVALIGGLLLIMFGVLDQESAVHHIDFNTIGLLIGMMIIVSITAETGVFKYLAIKTAKVAKADPVKILVYLAILTAVASALLDNVTTVLLVVPVTLSITARLKVNPLPYLISQIMASNIGGTATMIGDPPNIMLGSAVKELTFLAFINNLAAISFFILFVTVAIFAFMYRNKLKTTENLKAELMKSNEKDELKDILLLKKSLFIIGLTILGFFLHQFVHIETATIALFGAFLLLLLTGEDHLESSLERVEWTTLFFFIGLFVIVGGLVDTGVINSLAKGALEITKGDVAATSMLILWVSAIASAFIDNIPFVATMIPLIKDMGSMGIANLEPLWWSLALGACLGGNGTLIGASANLVVAGLAAKKGHNISFVKYLLIGFPLMLVSIVISTVYIYLRYLL